MTLPFVCAPSAEARTSDSGNTTRHGVVGSEPSATTVTVRETSVLPGVPGGRSGPNVIELVSGVGMMLMAVGGVGGLIIHRRLRAGPW